jgi:hypothetical protein
MGRHDEGVTRSGGNAPFGPDKEDPARARRALLHDARTSGLHRWARGRDHGARGAAQLDSGGFPHTEREVLVVRVLDEPGALGQVALVMATATINIDTGYVTAKGYVVLGVDDLPGALHVAAGMAVMVVE